MDVIGPTLGNGKHPIIYCLDSDESSAIEPETLFSSHSKAADQEYVHNNTAFTLSVLPITEPHDFLILDETFQKSMSLLHWHQKIYRMLSLTPTENLCYAPSKGFAPVAQKLARKTGISLISTIGFSHLQEKTFPSQGMLDVSKYLNAKTSLPDLSKRYGFSIPRAKVLPFKKLSLSTLKPLGFPNHPVYLKINGLGGGYHVKKITSDKDLQAFIHTHQKKAPLVAAQKGLPSSYIEREHIFIIYPDRIHYLYSSVQLTVESSWYGNLFEPTFALNPSHREVLERAAYALQQEGYSNDYGFLVGFDSLMSDHKIAILEINARWLGSLPVERLLTKLGILHDYPIFSSFDYLLERDLSVYQTFSEKHLFSPNKTSPFSVIPLSFSPYLTGNKRVISFIVVGELEAFYTKVRSTFSKSSFELLENSIKQINEKELLPIPIPLRS